MSFDARDPLMQPATQGSESPNPYAPTSNVAAPQPTDVESIRRTYLSHEASVRSIGTLYMLGAIIMVPLGLLLFVGSVGALAVGNGQGGNGPESIAVAVGALLYLSFGVAQGFVAVGLRRLKNWARITATVFSAIGLMAIPIGTLISAYFLYLLVSKKGQVVFSDEYKNVIAQTPHIVYKTSIIVWILLIILVLLIGLGIGAVVVSG